MTPGPRPSDRPIRHPLTSNPFVLLARSGTLVVTVRRSRIRVGGWGREESMQRPLCNAARLTDTTEGSSGFWRMTCDSHQVQDPDCSQGTIRKPTDGRHVVFVDANPPGLIREGRSGRVSAFIGQTRAWSSFCHAPGRPLSRWLGCWVARGSKERWKDRDPGHDRGVISQPGNSGAF